MNKERGNPMPDNNDEERFPTGGQPEGGQARKDFMTERGLTPGASREIISSLFEEKWREHRGMTPDQELSAEDRLAVGERRFPPSYNIVKILSEFEDDVDRIPTKEVLTDYMHQVVVSQIRKASDELYKASDFNDHKISSILGKLAEASTVEDYRREAEVLKALLGDLRKKMEDRGAQERLYKPPQSIQEVAEELAESLGPDWQEGGKYALFKKVRDSIGQEKMEFQKQNFLRWVRRQMMFLHDQNSDDPVQFFNQVRLFGKWRQISIGDMIDHSDNFFRDRDTGIMMKDLRDQVLYEAWLFEKARNYNIEYMQIRGSDEKLPDALASIYAKNIFTKPNTLKTILSMPNVDNSIDPGGDNQGTGQGLRAALLSYYYLSDGEMLEKVNRMDSYLFSNENFVEDFVKAKMSSAIYKTEEERSSKEAEFREAGKKLIRLSQKWFNPDGSFNNAYLKEYTDHINIFNVAMKDPDIVDEVRERIRLSIMKRCGLSYSDAEYAETFAFSMTRWTGIAAKNDTNAIGFDAWSKVMNFLEYRKRQAGKDRGGVFGNMFNMFALKRLGVGFFDGITDVQGRTILEVIQGDKGSKVGLENKIDELRFTEQTMNQFATNHIKTGFQLFHMILENKELSFDQFVKFDPLKGFIFDHQKANEVKDGMFKAFRYAFSTWDKLDYSKKVRTWVRQKNKDGEYELKAVDTSIAELLFGKEILDIDEFKTNGKIDPAKIQDKNNRKLLFKQAIKYFIAAEIKSHRDLRSPYTRYGLSELERIYGFLANIPAEIEGDESDMSKAHPTGTFFTKKDIDWIRKKSGTKFWSVFGLELGTGLGGGIANGARKGIGEFFKGIVK